MAKPGRAGRPLNVGQAIQQAVDLHRQGRFAEAERLYAGVLRSLPQHFDALRLLGVLRYQQGQFAEALRLIGAALRTNAGSSEAWSNYGLVLGALQRHDEALESYQRALALNPDDVDALLNHGNALQAAGRHADAIASYDQILSTHPRRVDALCNRGNALLALKRHDEALAGYDAALDVMPGHIDTLYNRGTMLATIGRHADALACLRRLLVLQPDHVSALNNAGAALLSLDRPYEALERFDRALAIKPDHIGALVGRGHALIALDRFTEGEALSERVAATAPDHAAALGLRGAVLRMRGRHEEALACFDRAVAHAPDSVDARKNRGQVLLELKQPERALADFDHVLAAWPRDAAALANRGHARFELADFDGALASYAEALSLDPEHADAHYGEGLVRLTLGDFALGWDKYRWRRKVRQMARHGRTFAQPHWSGDEPLAGKTVLLHAEQGFGDTIQFARYATLMAERGAGVLLEVQRPLVGLLGQIEGVSRVIARGDDLPAFDLHCPLLDLPYAFRTELATVPARVPYLWAGAERAAAWKPRLNSGAALSVGLVWSGNAAYRNDSARSVPLAALAPLLAHAGVQFVCLQHELRDNDAPLMPQLPAIRFFGEQLRDFADTVALISLLDVVITVDTVFGHLAGAMGKPTWLLLSRVPDSRWLLDRADSPWYPTVRLFRQPRVGDWESVLAQVERELGGLGKMS